MRKRLVGVVCVLTVLLCTCGVSAKDVSVLENEISVSVEEKNDGGSLLFPLRDIFSKAGYDVFWDSVARDVRVSKDFKNVVYTIGKDGVLVDNERVCVDVAPKLIDNKTYISVDALERGLGNKVKWNKEAGTVTINKDNYIKGNWNDILPLEKTYQSKDSVGKVLGSITVRVPQVENPMNKESIEKINEYYRNEVNRVFDEYKKLLPSDVVSHMGDEVKYNTSYVVTYNSNDMLSVVMVQRNKKSVNVKCDVFDLNTGEKMELHDIIKVDKSGIDKFKMNAITEHLKGNGRIDADDIMFFIDDGDLVLAVNNGMDVLEHRIKAVENKRLFRKNLQNTFNYDQEVLAKKVACKCCKQRVRFVDKTIIDGRECYVFVKCYDVKDSIIAVDKYCEKLYALTKQDGAYVVLSKNDLGDGMISGREALGIVRQKLNNTGYTYELCGNMISNKNGHVYSIVRVKDTDGQVNKRIAVSRVDKSLYVEKSSGLAKLDTNADGTVTAVGYFEIDNNLTDTSEWGHIYLGVGSKMTIGEDGSGLYYIADVGEEKVEHFRMVSQDGKTYIEITNKDDEGSLPRGTRFLVEVKEIGNSKYLYVHDEDNKDIKQGNKYWRLVVEGYNIFEPMNENI